MVLKIKQLFLNNMRIIILTFEIFWVVVFLLNNIASDNLIEIPQFIYVNF